MNCIPNIYADIIPFYGAAGFSLGMKFDDFISKANHMQASDEFICNWWDGSNDIHKEIWHIKDEIITDFFDKNPSTRLVSCYWNHDVLMVFSSNNPNSTPVLESITLAGNYSGKVLGVFGINDVIGSFSHDYNFEIYADACYLLPKNSDSVIGAEIYLGHMDENSEDFLDQKIFGIRIYQE